jgi:hypothetical protein
MIGIAITAAAFERTLRRRVQHGAALRRRNARRSQGCSLYKFMSYIKVVVDIYRIHVSF